MKYKLLSFLVNCTGSESACCSDRSDLRERKLSESKRKGFPEQTKYCYWARTYADFMPIWVWVIEHPEGIIVIDTGDIRGILS